MRTTHKLGWVGLGCLISVVTLNSCGWLQSKPKFAEAADIICSGLEDFEHLHNTILTVHMLMEREDYAGALKVADSLLDSIDEAHEVEGMNELRALIFILESIVKGHKSDPH